MPSCCRLEIVRISRNFITKKCVDCKQIVVEINRSFPHILNQITYDLDRPKMKKRVVKF